MRLLLNAFEHNEVVYAQNLGIGLIIRFDKVVAEGKLSVEAEVVELKVPGTPIGDLSIPSEVIQPKNSIPSVQSGIINSLEYPKKQ